MAGNTENQRRMVMAKADALSTLGLAVQGPGAGAREQLRGGTSDGLAELDRMIEFFNRAMTEYLNWSQADALALYIYCQQRRVACYGAILIVPVGEVH